MWAPELVKIKNTIKVTRQYLQEKYQMKLLEILHTHTYIYL